MRGEAAENDWTISTGGSDNHCMICDSADRGDIIEISNRLRLTRIACRRFIFLWAMSLVERKADLEIPADAPAANAIGNTGETADDFKEILNFDWSFLYPPAGCDD